MTMLERLTLGGQRRVPRILQTEAAECGLAAVGMVAGFHGHHQSLANLRGRFPVSLKGSTLASLIHVASQLGLASRPVKADLGALDKLALPCILHWEFNHFVVLTAIDGRGTTVIDPARGARKVTLGELSAAYTGVALELWPTPDFQPARQARPVRLRELTGRITGLGAAFSQVLLLALALEVLTVVQPFFLQWVVDHVLNTGDRDLLTTLALAFGLLMVMLHLTSVARSWMLLYLGTTLNLQWRANVFTHLLRLPVAYFERRHLGDIVSRFGAIDAIQRTVTTSFLEALLDGMVMTITLVLMFLYSPPLAWIALGAMALYGAARWAGYAALRHATEEHIVHAAKEQSHFLETVRGVKAIKLFQHQDDRRSRWLTLLVNEINADLRVQKWALFFRTFNGLLFGLSSIAILWLGARQVLGGQFTVGALLAFIVYKTLFDKRVAALLDKLVDVKMLRLQGERLADIVHEAPEPVDDNPPASGEPSGPPIAVAPVIEVRDLRFRYSAHEPYVLDGVSLRIEAGESVAITGPSGGGKTTLINILLGVLTPTEGEVLVDGAPVRGANAALLRRIAGTVLQDDVLFAGSIAENISFFDPRFDADRARECARIADIHDDIVAMPMGYNTLVGDMGTVLSGGQKQRVLLARALYKRPMLLFLDEATSHLDLARERVVNMAISRLAMTRVIVAHRPDTIAAAGREIVLLDGKVAADSGRREVRPAGRTRRRAAPLASPVCD
ncbi:ABC transporter [Achromobacter piechaudii]|uniref:peptidase domain-containing ABC transporter n=1 Tax=Achromobacter piechaudii TaxID=72556 RepID=UPI0006A49ABB|nr:peptidase domain-containing ABC transporter [Achromobacter piechaudii]KNY10009.1 ABC transporter [Achromobacter piechaudii]